jgi:hypothetical protein
MSTTTLSEVLLNPNLSIKAEAEARKLSSEATTETHEVIAAFNERFENEKILKDKERAVASKR